MAGENAPDLARVLDLRLPNLQVFEGNPLAIEHPVDIVIGLDEQHCRVRKGLVLRKPGRLRMPVRTDDRQGPDVCVQSFGYLSRCGFGRKQTVFVDQHGCNFALSRRGAEG